MFNRKPLQQFSVFLLLVACAPRGHAATESGLSLLQVPGARSAALGEALTAGSDDVSALQSNPSSLATLSSGRALFSFERGFADDSFGQLYIGKPVAHGGIGAVVGYYDGGDIQVFDGVATVNIKVQRDILVGLAVARQWNSFEWGMQTKYLSSELGETDRATAYAGDVGVGYTLNSRNRVGASLQNYGTKLRYREEGDALPRVARAGFTTMMTVGAVKAQLLTDAAYFENQREMRPAVGLEIKTGVLALRSGYRQGRGSGEVTMGTGFEFGRINFDYSFALMKNVADIHKMSLGMRFGEASPAVAPQASTPVPAAQEQMIPIDPQDSAEFSIDDSPKEKNK